jgi:hypothetical protein
VRRDGRKTAEGVMNEPEERWEEGEEEEEEARERGEKTEDERIEEAAKVAEALNGFTTCAFCGMEFRKDNNLGQIKAHIYFKCSKHPVGQLNLKLAGFQDIIDKYDSELTEIRTALTKAGVQEIGEKGNRRWALNQIERIKILRGAKDAAEKIVKHYDGEMLKIRHVLTAEMVPMFDDSGRLLTPIERIKILAERAKKGKGP